MKVIPGSIYRWSVDNEHDFIVYFASNEYVIWAYLCEPYFINKYEFSLITFMDSLKEYYLLVEPY